MKTLNQVLAVLLCFLFLNNPTFSQRSTTIKRSTTKAQTNTFLATATSTAWIARHGLSGSAYQNEFTKHSRKGYRLVHVAGYEVRGAARYAAIWEKKSGPAMRTHHGMTSAVYQQKFNTYSKQGYRPTHISGYDVKGKPYFAAIWEKKSGPAWVARHNMTGAKYQQEFNLWKSKGYRLVKVSGYAAGTSARYAAIWEKNSGPSMRTHHGMTSANYQQ